PVFSIHFDCERVRPEVASRRIEPPKTVRIGGRTRAEWVLAPHSDAQPPLLNHVPAEWAHESPLHALWPKPANHFEVCWRSVDLSFALIRCRRNGPLTDVVPAKPVQFVQLANHEVGCPPVRYVAVLGKAECLLC